MLGRVELVIEVDLFYKIRIKTVMDAIKNRYCPF